MTDIEINEAITQHCEEKRYGVIKLGLWYRPNEHGYTYNPDEAARYTLKEAKHHEIRNGLEDDVLVMKLPSKDYFRDLNAMHEAEEKLTNAQQMSFCWKLQQGFLPETSTARWLLCHSTARQHAEAFLRTIGKWKE